MRQYWKRFLVFFSFVTTVLGIAYSFVAVRLTVGLVHPGLIALVWILAAVSLLLAPLAFALRMFQVPERIEKIIAWTSYLSFGFFAMLFALIASRDLGLVAVDQVGGIVDRFLPWRDPANLLHPMHREFLVATSNAALLGLAGGMFVYGVIRARAIGIERVQVPIDGLPESLHGFTIAQITDIHIGPTLKRSFALEIVKKVNNLKADMIAVTGDVVDGSVQQLRDHTEPFADLEARHGVFFVTGNHEYYSGALSWISEFRNLGFQVLLNEHSVLEHAPGGNVMVAGVTDYRAAEFFDDHRSDPALALRRAARGSRSSKEPHVKILLAHQPRSIAGAADAGFDLQISGHTHGGQFFPGPYLVRLQQPYTKGLHRHGDKTWIYISRGTGYWGPPIRVGAPPEITLIELEPA